MRQSVMERNCLGFIPAYSRNKMLYDFVQSFEMFQPGIEPMTSCFELLPFYLHTTAAYAHMYAKFISNSVSHTSHAMAKNAEVNKNLYGILVC